MFALLKLKVSGFRMLADDFTLDFIPKARVNYEEDDSNEIAKIDQTLYTYNLVALTGSNASGKSSTLDLITKILVLMKTGRWEYVKSDFNSSKISLHIEFYLDKTIYIHDGDILPLSGQVDGQIASQFCSILNERTKFALYDSKAGKHYLDVLKFENDYNSSGIEDTSKLIFLCKDKSNGYYIPEFSKNGVMVSNLFFENLNFFNNELTKEIIRLLDNSIEYIIFDGTDNIRFKRFNSREVIVSKLDLLNLLSNGTIKGIDLYIRIALLLKTGGIMVIDEIENCFHKNLVNNLLFLITDKTLNKKNAQIIFSTHYVEILDIFDRRDNIFILHKNDNRISIENLYEDYEYRTEILKSKKFNNNAFNTLLNYDQLMKVKRLLKNEILNND